MALIKFGLISEVVPEKGLVRVSFPEDGIVSFPIPILVNGAKDTKFFYALDVNEHVVCLMDPKCENGVVLGAVYNEKNLPPSGTSNDETKVSFSDGSKVTFNRSTSTLTVETGTTKIESSPSGVEISKGGDNLKSIIRNVNGWPRGGTWSR